MAAVHANTPPNASRAEECLEHRERLGNNYHLVPWKPVGNQSAQGRRTKTAVPEQNHAAPDNSSECVTSI